MGRFVPEKNFHQLIRSFSALTGNGYKLVLAGDADFEDDYSKSLKTLAQQSGVILTGFIKEERLQSLLTHAQPFILPSSHEGLPIALLEAISYRLPVIVSDIPAN
jgi:glycosyltransferase involved in cell wall biosynthesis